MFYTLEYLNEDAEIEILRFDSDTKEYQIVQSKGTGGSYIEPGREWIYLCEELTDTEPATEFGTDTDIIKAWSQKIGEFRPEISTEEGYERTDAVTFIREIVSSGAVAHFMANLIESVTNNKDTGKGFIQDYNIGKIQ